jgi:hypothetical protein
MDTTRVMQSTFCRGRQNFAEVFLREHLSDLAADGTEVGTFRAVTLTCLRRMFLRER